MLNFLIIVILIYLVWALIYHKKDKSLTFGVYLEYLLTAILSLVLLFGIIFL